MASKDNPKCIVLSGCPKREEGVAGGAVTPGHLVSLASTGKYVVHPTAAGVVAPIFAVENENLAGGIGTAYASNDIIELVKAKSGDEIYGWLKAGSTAVVKGDGLESAGNGSFQKATHATGSATLAAAHTVAVALEAVDNSGGGSDVRIKLRVL